jgi:cytochrome c553
MFVSIYSAQARNPIRRTFFDTYTVAQGTHLDDLPSNAGHCGVCHFDFGGGGPRNPYGLGIEVGLNNGRTKQQAILDIENNDSDADGFINLIEITDVVSFGNTPTFPGLTASNYTGALNVDVTQVEPYVTPAGATDTIPPAVTVNSPNGGESIDADSYYAISYDASDAGGISHVNIYMSDDGGSTFKPVATNEPVGTGFSWFVPNLPGSNTRIVVEAVDVAGNSESDMSDADFTLNARPPGVVPTTLRDVEMAGTQPHEGAILDDPDVSCSTCHGNYDSANEPWFVWRGCMMSQAARDPFFFACMAIAEQDAPSVGDVCIRCHSPGGWQEGRSVDTSGDLLNAKDRHGIHCDFCHRMVDYDYVEGVSPAQDVDVLAGIVPLPLQYGNGGFINDPSPLMRGPYPDADASHQFVESPFHRSAGLCGTCHDVSNPAFSLAALPDYVPNTFDEEHPDGNVRNMFPVERTYSEWSRSTYAIAGVYAPQFAGNKADGIVSTCQDCHMRDVNARGCNEPGAPTRADMPLHDMMGGNTFVVDIIHNFFPDEVDAGQLLAAKLRAQYMIENAATLEVTPEDFGITVRVTNETGHKLPSGYPEGRRVWVNVKAYDAADQMIYESGHYDFDTAELSHDADAKIYEIHPGTSPGLAAALGVAAGQSFHFVISDTVYEDNRIPPRGFTNPNFEAIQSPPVHYAYADYQHWDDTQYFLPSTAESVDVTVYYQSTSKEYVEFLRDENYTNSAGQDLYDAWFAQGKAPPVVMAQVSTGVSVTASVRNRDKDVPLVYSLNQNYPNPFGPATTITYSLARKEHVNISVYDLGGRHVCSLVDQVQEPSRYRTEWDGTNDRGEAVPPGVYFIRYHAGSHVFSKKAILLK